VHDHRIQRCKPYVSRTMLRGNWFYPCHGWCAFAHVHHLFNNYTCYCVIRNLLKAPSIQTIYSTLRDQHRIIRLQVSEYSKHLENYILLYSLLPLLRVTVCLLLWRTRRSSGSCHNHGGQQPMWYHHGNHRHENHRHGNRPQHLEPHPLHSVRPRPQELLRETRWRDWGSASMPLRKHLLRRLREVSSLPYTCNNHLNL